MTLQVGERLKSERKTLGLSQPKVAEAAGVSKNTVIAWEKGDTSPNAVQLSVLSGKGFDILYVLTGERQMKVGKSVKEAPASYTKSLPVDSSMAAFAKKLDGLNQEFEQLKQKHSAVDQPAKLQDLVTFNTTARSELTNAIAQVMAVTQEEDISLTPQQFASAVVSALGEEDIEQGIANAQMW